MTAQRESATVDRRPQRDRDDSDWGDSFLAELDGVPGRVDGLVEDARRRCEAGDPGEALTLGRDLHWISGGDSVRERHARDLLVLAYRALDRPALAGIVEAHYRHRQLVDVDVFDNTRG